MQSQLWSEVEALHQAADAHVNAGDVDTGRRLSEQALHLAFQHAGAADPGVAACFLHIGRIEEGGGDLTGAEPRYNAACSILKPTEGDATPLKAEVLLAYGSLYAKMNLGWRAILLLEHAKARFVELAGPDDQHVGRCCAMLAVSQETVELEDEAMAHYDEALRILRTAWGVTHSFVEYLAWGRADLAFWRAMKRGDADGVTQALTDFRAGLARLEDTAGRDHPEAARRRATLGTYLVVNGQYDEGGRGC